MKATAPRTWRLAIAGTALVLSISCGAGYAAADPGDGTDNGDSGTGTSQVQDDQPPAPAPPDDAGPAVDQQPIQDVPDQPTDNPQPTPDTPQPIPQPLSGVTGSAPAADPAPTNAEPGNSPESTTKGLDPLDQPPAPMTSEQLAAWGPQPPGTDTPEKTLGDNVLDGLSDMAEKYPENLRDALEINPFDPMAPADALLDTVWWEAVGRHEDLSTPLDRVANAANEAMVFGMVHPLKALSDGAEAAGKQLLLELVPSPEEPETSASSPQSQRDIDQLLLQLPPTSSPAPESTQPAVTTQPTAVTQQPAPYLSLDSVLPYISQSDLYRQVNSAPTTPPYYRGPTREAPNSDSTLTGLLTGGLTSTAPTAPPVLANVTNPTNLLFAGAGN